MFFLPSVISLALLVVSVPDTHDEDRSIRRIDRVKQLLLDDKLIESLDGATRKLNQPTKYSGNRLIAMMPEGESSWDAEMIPSGFSSAITNQLTTIGPTVSLEASSSNRIDHDKRYRLEETVC